MVVARIAKLGQLCNRFCLVYLEGHKIPTRAAINSFEKNEAVAYTDTAPFNFKGKIVRGEIRALEDVTSLKNLQVGDAIPDDEIETDWGLT